MKVLIIDDILHFSKPNSLKAKIKCRLRLDLNLKYVCLKYCQLKGVWREGRRLANHIISKIRTTISSFSHPNHLRHPAHAFLEHIQNISSQANSHFFENDLFKFCNLLIWFDRLLLFWYIRWDIFCMCSQPPTFSSFKMSNQRNCGLFYKILALKVWPM